MSTITYDQAVESLKSMFESCDTDSLVAVFQSNNFNLERTIETILQMESGPQSISDDESGAVDQYGFENPGYVIFYE